jgi:hypothetical protein
MKEEDGDFCELVITLCSMKKICFGILCVSSRAQILGPTSLPSLCASVSIRFGPVSYCFSVFPLPAPVVATGAVLGLVRRVVPAQIDSLLH